MPDTVFLTGGTGFVGSHILRELKAAGYEVRALARTNDPRLECEIVIGDLERSGEFARAMEGCRYVVHCAALYSFAPADRKRMHAVNVLGTAGILEAARVAGVERVVLTSSSATLGPSPDGTPRTENDYADDDGPPGYHHSKLEQERAAFSGRVPVIALLPTAPVGPGDWKPTPTGSLVRDFTCGKIFAKPPGGGLNVVPVEDVARAHVSALTRGNTGERYILGGENLSLDDLWALLAEVTGRGVPAWRVPHAFAMAIAYADEARCRLRPGAQPAVPVEGVRMSREFMYADSSKAKAELGFSAGSVREALERAVAWYRAHGYCN